MFKSVLFCAAIALVYGQVPSYMNPCKLSDPKLNDCALKNAHEAFKFIIKGDKRYHIQPLEKFMIKSLLIKPSDQFTMELKNFFVYGLKDAVIKSVNLNPKTLQLEVVVDIPELKLTGNYEAQGKILILPIEGSGPFDIRIIKGEYKYVVDVQKYQKKGVKYGKLVNGKLTHKLHNVKIDLKNLFNGDSKLGDELNKFLNENWAAVFEDLGATIRVSVEEVINSIIGGFLRKVPIDELMLQ